MAIFGVYVINRAGSLIYQYDHNMPRVEVEKTFSFPLDLTLKIYDGKVVVAFGQRDGVKVGHTVLAVNGQPAEGRFLKDDRGSRDILEVIADNENYPIAIKFGRPKLSSNEKIMLAGIKFIVITDPRRNTEELLLRKLYEIYSDFALKNPFYSLDMPIRCELFETNLQQIVELAEKNLLSSV